VIKWIVSLGLLVCVAALAWTLLNPAPAAHPHTVAFDNAYGAARQLTVYVGVDGAEEQKQTADCTPAACTFSLPLTDGPHTLAVAIEHNGRRSSQTTVNVDTTKQNR
jgi:hypothetical protein